MGPQRSRRGILRTGVAATLGALCTAACPVTAGAAETVIGFDNLAPGTQVTTQYRSDDKSRSIDFTPFGVPANLPTVVDASPTQSPPHAGRLVNCEKEFCEDEVRGSFENAFTHRFVRVYVGGAVGTYKLTAHLSTGAQVTKTATVDPDPGVLVPIQADDPAGKSRIDSFVVSAAGASSKVDDVTFDSLDPGQPPPPKDFSLGRDLSNNLDLTGSVNLLPGKSTTVRLVITRLNGSTGGITFQTSALPAGVTASFQPSTASNANGEVVNLVLKANASVPPSTRNLTISAIPSSAQAGPETRTLDVPLRVFANYDLRVTGIEVTQGIQSEVTPCTAVAQCDKNVSLPAKPSGDSTAAVTYQGVPLAQRKKTVARVFANLRVPTFPDGLKVPGVSMELHAFNANGKELAESPLVPDYGTRTVSSGGPGFTTGGAGMPWVTFKDRADADGAFTFTLPDDWTDRSVLTLRAEATPPLTFVGTTDAECETSECRNNNTFTLGGIRFYPTGYISVATVRMPVATEFFLPPPPGETLSLAELWWPLGDEQVYYDRRFHDGEKFLKYADKDIALDELEDYADEHDGGCERGNLCSDIVLGLFSDSIDGGGVSNSDFPGQTVMNFTRTPSIAHEMSHNLGRGHPGRSCSVNDEDWPPDEKGFIQGIGLDTRAASGGGNAPYAVIAPGDQGATQLFPGGPTQQARYYDYMSYCHSDSGGLPGDTDRWTSVLGQSANLDLLQFIGRVNCRIPGDGPFHNPLIASFPVGCSNSLKAPPATIAQGPPTPGLRVQALARDSGEVVITRVKPISDRPEPSPPSSRFTLVARNSGGAVVSTTPMKTDRGDDPVTFLSAEASAPGAASVEILRDGAPVAGRSRTAATPLVRILSPRKGATVGRTKNVSVRWQGTDADSPDLTAKVDYSLDDGRTWLPIHGGDNTGRASIPSSMLAGSRRGRLRVRVNDGFNEGSAVSGRLLVAGRGPSIKISSPARGQRVMSDSALYLSASVFDERGFPVTGRRVRWFLGRRLLGRGTKVSALGLPAGRRRIRVVARDRRGRSASASVAIRVLRATPQFLRLGRPSRIARRARRIVLRVASSLPATLRAGGRRYNVDRRAKRIAVPIRPGGQRLSLPLRLTASGKSRRVVLVIPRG
jgi:hypothetical protein